MSGFDTHAMAGASPKYRGRGTGGVCLKGRQQAWPPLLREAPCVTRPTTGVAVQASRLGEGTEQACLSLGLPRSRAWDNGSSASHLFGTRAQEALVQSGTGARGWKESDKRYVRKPLASWFWSSVLLGSTHPSWGQVRAASGDI